MIFRVAAVIVIAVVMGYRLWRRWRLDRLLRQVVDFSRPSPPSEHRLVYDLLRFGLRPAQLWHDLYVPKGDGNYAQVDAVALTQTGIIVFEVKEYSGKIYGDGYSYRWKQYGRGRNKPRSFYSPVRQNDGHIRTLERLLRPTGGKIPFWSVIVFYGDCRLKNIDELDEDTYVIRARHLKRTLREIMRSGSKARYADVEAVDEILDRSAINGADSSLRSRHVEYVMSLHRRPSWFVRIWRWIWRWLMER